MPADLEHAVAARLRYDKGQDRKDLDVAIQLFRQTKTEESFLTFVKLLNLAYCLLERFGISPSRDDLRDCIQLCRQAKAEIVEAYRPELLRLLAEALAHQYGLTGTDDDLRAAIEAAEESIATPHPDIPAPADVLATVAMHARDHYEQAGELRCLDVAVTYTEQAAELTPDDKPDELAIILQALESHLQARYRHTMNDVDKDRSIYVARWKLSLIPEDSPKRPQYLNDLAEALYSRREVVMVQTRRVDLEEAITYHREAVSLTANDSPEHARHLNRLVDYLLRHYHRGGEAGELDEAIELAQRVLSNSAADQGEYLIALKRLGDRFISRYWRFQLRADIDAAIQSYREAVSAAGSEPLKDSLPLNGALSDRYDLLGAQEDLDAAVDGYRNICNRLAQSDPHAVLAAGREWGTWALKRHAWDESVEAFRHALEALGAILKTRRSRSEKETELFYSRDLHTMAAYALARVGDLHEAATVLEGGLARLMTEASRSPKIAYPHGCDDSSDRGFAELSAERIREVLTEPLTDEAEPAAGVYLVNTAVGGLALIVHRGGFCPVWFDMQLEPDRYSNEYSYVDVFWQYIGTVYLTAQVHAPKRLPSVLAELLPLVGGRMARLIVDTLTDALPCRTSSNRLLRVIPTGIFGQFPIHAACYEKDGSERTLLDDFTVVYAPAGAVFERCQKRAKTLAERQGRLLAVGNPQPSGLHPLKYARLEVEKVSALFESCGTVRALYETEARSSDVETNIGTATHLHFACHASFDMADPKKSGIALSGGHISVADLLDRPSLTRARLCVLSACQTSTTDAMRLPDEPLGIAAGFVHAGVPGVVGALWSVIDVSTAFIMIEFYRRYLGERGERSEAKLLPPHQALRAAQQWLRSATNSELALFLTRLAEETSDVQQYASTIRRFEQSDPNGRPFKDPYYWAPFTYIGA